MNKTKKDYIIIDPEDAVKYLTKDEKSNLVDMIDKIRFGRVDNGNPPDIDYSVKDQSIRSENTKKDINTSSKETIENLTIKYRKAYDQVHFNANKGDEYSFGKMRAFEMVIKDLQDLKNGSISL